MNARVLAARSLTLFILALSVFCAPMSYAAGDWTCGPVSDGPPGTCPDCIFICGSMVDAHTLALAVFVSEKQAVVLCSADVTAVQNGEAFYAGTAVPASPVSLTAGWHSLAVVQTATAVLGAPFSISASGNFSANPAGCD